MQKIAVNVITNNSLDIPIVRFHYGKVLTTFLEPEKYRETLEVYEVVAPDISNKIIKAIEYEIEQLTAYPDTLEIRNRLENAIKQARGRE